MINVPIESLLEENNPIVNSNDTLRDTIKKMREYNQGFVVILKDKSAVGILSERDVIRLFKQKVDLSENVMKFATKSLITVRKDRSVFFAVNLLVENNIRRLIVVDEKGDFVGTVTMKKLLLKLEEDIYRKNLTLKDLQGRKNIISVSRKTPVKEAIEIMFENNIGSILVVDNEHPVGIFTERDVLNKYDELDSNQPIEMYMSSPVETIDIETSVYDVLKVMDSKKISRLVLTQEGKFVSFITQRDIIKAISGNFETFLERKLKSTKDILDIFPELIVEVIDMVESQYIQWMNKKAKDVFGNLIGNDIVTIIPEKDWGYLYSKLLKDKKVEKLKVTDGERVFEVSGSYIISDIKEFRGKIKLLLRDISKEKEDQNIILKELQTYKSILDSIEDMIIIYQADNGRIKMFNRSVMKKLGYTQEELKNMTIFDIVEEDKDFLKQNIEKIVRKGEVVSGKRTYKEVHGGKIPVEVNATSVTFNGNPHILIVARDISLRIKLEEEINYRNSQMQILHNFVLALNKATSIKESYNILAKILLNIVKIDKLIIYRINPSLNAVVEKLYYGFDKEPADLCLNGELLECKVMISGDTIVENDKFAFQCGKLKLNYGSFLCSNVVSSGKTIAIINMISMEENFFTKEKVEFIESLINAFSPFASTLNLIEINKELSLKDSLTNLYNRRYIIEFFTKEIGKAKRLDYNIGVLVIDVDNFKKLNDTYGHLVGDLCLKKVSNVFLNSVREMDIVGRWGGEEFIVILPGSDEESTYQIAERIRKKVSSEVIFTPDNKILNITVSIGMAVYPKDGDNLDDLIKVADEKLYQAKKSGKNLTIR